MQQQPNQPNPVQSTIVAVALIVLVGVIVWRPTIGTIDRDSFAAVWAGVGPLIGVLAGAIPAFFFRAQAYTEKVRADTERRRAAQVSDQAKKLAVLVPDSHAADAQRILDQTEPPPTVP